jgi:hypothetical protein
LDGCLAWAGHAEIGYHYSKLIRYGEVVVQPRYRQPWPAFDLGAELGQPPDQGVHDIGARLNLGDLRPLWARQPSKI